MGVNRHCEFCDELSGIPGNRFARQYKGVLGERILWRDSHFVILPTLGQLFEGSLLLLPNSHAERFNDLSNFQQKSATKVIRRALSMSTLPSSDGDQHHLIFEHGARACDGRGCGIYHAHIHIVPLPRPVSLIDLTGLRDIQRCDSLFDAWAYCSDWSEYLIVGLNTVEASGASRQNFVAARGNGSSPLVPSQHMRQRIVEYFELPYEWDWRSYTQQEQYLKNVVKHSKDVIPGSGGNSLCRS